MLDLIELEKLDNEYNVLKKWFDRYFQPQLIQSMWQTDFTISHDEYFNKDYAHITELKLQAEKVRKRIKELKKLLNEN